MGNYSGGLSLARHAAYQTSRNLAQSAMRNSISLDMATKPKQFKPFTKYNYRENLKIHTEKFPSSNMEAHHVFPQELAEKFLEKGIHIHDPKYLASWEKTPHRINARSYNQEWSDFMIDYPNATANQILERGRKVMIRYESKTNY